MAVNRDLSAIVLAKWPGPLGSVLDGLAATGAWGIRMALETRADRVTFNDWSPEATRLIPENIRRNGLVASAQRGDLRSFLGEGRYDFVDVDPFGPPTPFLASVFDGVKGSAGIRMTPPPAALLSGPSPNGSRKRHGAPPRPSPPRAALAPPASLPARQLGGAAHAPSSDRGEALGVGAPGRP